MLFDTFMFFNELDLLEIRLEVLDATVDRFVLVESVVDHNGRAKPLYFDDNRSRFERFLPKIEHVVVRDSPIHGTAWKRENHQREAILRGLSTMAPDDVVLMSDLDEIPNPSAITASLERCRKHGGVAFFEQTYHCYFLNCVNQNAKWLGSAMLRGRDLTSPQRIRDYRTKKLNWFRRNIHPRVWVIDNGGWHFTYLGGVDAIITKIESFAHNEFNTDEYKSPERILQRMEQGHDLFLDGHATPQYGFTAIDGRYPAYLQAHADRYQHLTHFPKKNPVPPMAAAS